MIDVQTNVEGPLETIRFTGLDRGPKLIVMGAVHGNETCGPNAILRAVADCRSGRLPIRRGRVTFVPVVNLKAYHQATREGDRNLNRDLREKTIPVDYEDRIVNLICGMLREHEVLLDIHSFSGEGTPFIFAGPLDNRDAIEPFRFAKAEGEFAARLGTAMVIHGWLDVYGRFLAERERLGFSNRAISEGVGTTEYMRFSGGYGVTLECGAHDDPKSDDVAYAAILNAVTHLGLVDAPAPPVAMQRAIQITDMFICEAEGDRIEGPWRTGDAIAAGHVFARRADGKAVAAPVDGFIVFPNRRPQPGDGLCYFGVASPRVF